MNLYKSISILLSLTYMECKSDATEENFLSLLGYFCNALFCVIAFAVSLFIEYFFKMIDICDYYNALSYITPFFLAIMLFMKLTTPLKDMNLLSFLIVPIKKKYIVGLVYIKDFISISNLFCYCVVPTCILSVPFSIEDLLLLMAFFVTSSSIARVIGRYIRMYTWNSFISTIICFTLLSLIIVILVKLPSIIIFARLYIIPSIIVLTSIYFINIYLFYKSTIKSLYNIYK